MPQYPRLLLFGLAFLSLAPLAGATFAFTDTDSGNPYFDAIEYLKTKEIVTGYKDGTFRSERTVNRAELVKVLAKSLIAQDDIDRCTREYQMDFTDVPKSAWFAPYVCIMKKNGFIDGYEDKTFRPSATMNIAEASKIFAMAFNVSPVGTGEGELWHKPFTMGLASVHAIPAEVQATGESLTRGVMAEMLWRLKENVTDRDAANGDELIAAQCEWFADEPIANVDLQEVRRVWLSWINQTRKELGLHPYVQNKQLNRSAAIWSQKAKAMGTITHKRTANAAYYSYAGIEDWFQSVGLSFQNVNRITFTENIGWGVYRCSKEDCTQDMINAIRSTYTMYLSERGKASAAHWNSMINSEFTSEGMGLTVDQNSGKYYITTHYGTKITSDPDPVCP